MTTLIMVDARETAEAMQHGIDPVLIQFAWPGFPLIGRYFERIYVRWPTGLWFERHERNQGDLRFRTEQAFQDYVRTEVAHRMRGAHRDFQYI